LGEVLWVPELPEMETYLRQLIPRVCARDIANVEVNREKTVRATRQEFTRRVRNRAIVDVTRRAKHLVFWLDSGDALLLHLMLGGWMFYGEHDYKPAHESQVVLSFGSEHLFFHGLGLGYLHLLTKTEVEAKLRSLGPDPLGPLFTAATLQRALQSRRGVLKTALTNQQCISGIGNCYSDEICFEAGIHPLFQITNLTLGDFQRLHSAMDTILYDAIGHGGYMEFPLFDGDALTGGYNERCRVYDRGGEPCLRCGNPIVKTEHSGRKVFFCVNCQPK
jgi:formamidopyrimidine-DNA glycosylase